MRKEKIIAFLTLSCLVGTLASCSETNVGDITSNELKKVEVISSENDYTIVESGQSVSYDKDGNILEGEDAIGQDAYYEGLEFSFTDNGDGTVTDNNTGLMWQQVPSNEKYSWSEAQEFAENYEFAGYDDWRVPTAKELFALSDFEKGWPYLDTTYFDFADSSSSTTGGGPGGEGMSGGPQTGASDMSGPQGNGAAQGGGSEGSDKNAFNSSDSEGGEGDMPPPPSNEGSEGGVSKQEGQFWTSNFYEVGTTHGDAPSAFGVNHATGHIKAYPAEAGGQMGKYVRLVRGGAYAENDFVDNGDGTITDNATGLMWTSDDSGEAVEWEDAIDYCENLEYAGYSDYKLPNVKELHSIVDYSGVYPAIDADYFNTSVLEENVNYYFWTNTSAYFSTQNPGYGYAWYVAFGKAVGNDGEDSHGAGAIRFSPKYEGSSFKGEGGDNVYNSVRCVREI